MTDLSYVAEWNSIVALEDYLMPNNYRCELFFNVLTDDGDDQNVAFDRCKIMLEIIFADAMFINMFNPLLPPIKQNFKSKTITLPTEPLDLVIASLIYHKLNAICQDKLYIEKVTLSSTQGENITIHFDEEFAEESNIHLLDEFNKINEQPWWLRDDASHSDWIENLDEETKFHKHVVNWDEKLTEDGEQAKIDNKPNKKWKPTIIDGGKTQH
jgi:hypothetical protein